MKVLVLSKYSNQAASARLRFSQMFPWLQRQNIWCELAPLLDDVYLQNRFSGKRLNPWQICKAFLKRVKRLTDTNYFDFLVVQYELFPYVPTLVENLLNRSKLPYILDFDDAIFHQYDNHPSYLVRLLVAGKIERLISRADHVTAGCQYLADFARQYNSQVDLLPTVVDLNAYQRLKDWTHGNSGFTIGWMGSPSTANFLHTIAEPLRAMAKLSEVRIVVVGAGAAPLPDVSITKKEWSQTSEVDQLLGFDVGIMPLSDDPWTRGKCGFKLIQYMACGLPVVASPVGANCDIVKHGETGYLAATSHEWLSALMSLRQNKQVRESLGRAGRCYVERDYCLSVVAPKLARVFRSVINSGPRSGA